MKALFYVPHGSCYLEIVKVKYSGPEYFKAHVRWYSRPGKTFLLEQKNLKILNTAREIWQRAL